MSEIRRRGFLEMAALSLASAATPAAPGERAEPEAQFSLVGAVDGRAPFALGMALRPGEIPAGAGIVGTIEPLQATVMTRWPDGSARFAVVAGRASLVAGRAQKVRLAATAAHPPAPALGPAELRRIGLSAAIDAGALGQARWEGADWASPFLEWVSGPLMSSWVYRKPIGDDPSLVAWLELRLWAGGEVEVLPWIENGSLLRPHPTSKAAPFSFALGGKTRFALPIDLPAQCRTVLVSGAALSHWLDRDPEVAAMQDSRHLQATRLVPSYLARVGADAPGQRALPEAFVPLQRGNYSNTMGQTGYQPAIGLLPEWDVLYLTAADRRRALQGLQRNAYSAGGFPIHRRDETTNRPLRFSSHPHLSTAASTTGELAPAPSGTAAAPGGWDVSHHPSVGYMAHLATGRWYFLEELQFAATENYLYQVDDVRRFSQGVFLSASGSSTTRGAAWANRTLLQAALATPDRDPLQREFVASLEANIRFNHETYVARANNPFGIVAPYGNVYAKPGETVVREAAWQQDFYTAAFGYMLAAQPPISAPARRQLEEFFAWKARSIVGRLGGTQATDWLYADAAVYVFVVALVAAPDWMKGSGPWPKDWGQLYEATLGHPNPGSDPGALRGAYIPDGTSYWGNLLPAISYAVEHGVAGAASAYARLTGASNWRDLVASFDQAPVWGLRPS